ncbi:MAG: polysaccharide deacetylase family protein, partial [Clostridia bacterium]|nr:polysaccharide deacetylase family protein [Clostridia bacterium]
MRIVKFLCALCLLLFVLAGCEAAEPIHTEPLPETTESVTAQLSMIESGSAVSAAIEPVTTVQVSSESSVTMPVTTEIVTDKLAGAVPVTTVLQTTESVPDSVMVPILMFHDVKTYAGGTWSMSADNFRKRMEFLLDNGYTPVTFEQLADYADGAASLPKKPVCITFDDGYYSNYKNVLPIVTELQIPITVFVICSAVRPEGVEPDANEEALSMMSAAEIAQMEASPFVQVQSHTYDLHIVGY